MAKNGTAEEKMTPDTTDVTEKDPSLTQAGKRKSATSMSMIEPRFRNIYKSFYKESYFTPTTLDLKTKELIAIGASLAAKCEGCLQGHIKKALEIGLTKAEISDAIVIAVGIAAAGVVDMSDHAATKLDLHHFE
ncbi:MAG TPA: carboxymuconolactone decarboxylase family protein [Terriglobia bacterium]|nr:carboxymuconolactone decarboxylase family protein [Terriglobia bacterium]